MGAVSGKEPLVNAVKACYSGDENVVMEFLQQHPHDINAISPLHNHTMLYGAARNGHDKIVDLLLHPMKYGLLDVAPANIDIQCGRSQSTALHAASFYGKVSTVRLLNSNGANPHVKNIYGYTAVQEATRDVARLCFPESIRRLYQPMEVGSITATILTTENKVNDTNENNDEEQQPVSVRPPPIDPHLQAAILATVAGIVAQHYPTNANYDVSDEELDVQWEQISGVSVTAKMSYTLHHQKINGDGEERLSRLRALLRALRVLQGYGPDYWTICATQYGTSMEFSNIFLKLPTGHHRDIHPIESCSRWNQDVMQEIKIAPLRSVAEDISNLAPTTSADVDSLRSLRNMPESPRLPMGADLLGDLSSSYEEQMIVSDEDDIVGIFTKRLDR